MALWKWLSLKNVLQQGLVKNKNYGSALYIVGDKATDVCVVVNPHVAWDGDVEVIKKNILRRGIKQEGVENLGDSWEFYTKLKLAKKSVDKKVIECTDKIKELNSSGDNLAQEEMDKYKIQRNIMKEDLRTLRSSMWAAEEKAVLGMLALPNCLHPLTPDEAPTVIFTHGDKPQVADPVDHVELAIEQDLLQLYSSQSYYLKNDAALFELCSKYYFSDNLRKLGYVQFSNADFVKSVVVEGCGGNHRDSDCVFILHHNEDSKVDEDLRLHLVGGGSLYSFAAYHTKNVVPRGMLPLRYFALGRQYKPVPVINKLGLYQVAQSAVVEMFTMTENCPQKLDEELHKVVEAGIAIYRSIGQHFRVCYSPASRIQCWESLRVSFQMFSPSLNTYIEVGNISVSDDYISKRLQILHRRDKDLDFVKIISGTLLNVPKLLACSIECSPDSFQIPDIFKQYLS